MPIQPPAPPNGFPIIEEDKEEDKGENNDMKSK